MINKEFREGWEAARQGRHIIGNPYRCLYNFGIGEVGTVVKKWRSWSDGYKHYQLMH